MSSNMHSRRKYGIASDETDCAFIPKHARSQWPDKISIAFATYNRQWKPDHPMDPGIMRTVMARGNRGVIGAGGKGRSGNRAAR